MADTYKDIPSTKITRDTLAPFLSNLSKQAELTKYTKHVIVCHNDADGLCAGVLAQSFFPGAEFSAKSHEERIKTHDDGKLYLYVDIQPLIDPSKVPKNIFCIDHHSLTNPLEKDRAKAFISKTYQSENYFIYDPQGTDNDMVSTATILVEFLAYVSGAVDYGGSDLVNSINLQKFANSKAWKFHKARKELVLCGAITDNAQHISPLSNQKRLRDDWFKGEKMEELRDYSLAISLCLGEPEEIRLDSLRKFIEKGATEECTNLKCVPGRLTKVAHNLILLIKGFTTTAEPYYRACIKTAQEDYLNAKSRFADAKEKFTSEVSQLLKSLGIDDFSESDIVEYAAYLNQSANKEDVFQKVNSLYADQLKALLKIGERGAELYNEVKASQRYMPKKVSDVWYDMMFAKDKKDFKRDRYEYLLGITEDWMKFLGKRGEKYELLRAKDKLREAGLRLSRIEGDVEEALLPLDSYLRSWGTTPERIKNGLFAIGIQAFDSFVERSVPHSEAIRSKLIKLNEEYRKDAASKKELEEHMPEFSKKRRFGAWEKKRFHEAVPGLCVFMSEQFSEQIKGILSSYIYYYSFPNIVIETRYTRQQGQIALWGARGPKLEDFVEFLSTLNITSAVSEAYEKASKASEDALSNVDMASAVEEASKNFSKKLHDEFLQSLKDAPPEGGYGGRDLAYGGTIKGKCPSLFSDMPSAQAAKTLLNLGINGEFKGVVDYLKSASSQNRTVPQYMSVFSSIKASNWVTFEIDGSLFDKDGNFNKNTKFTLHFGGEHLPLDMENPELLPQLDIAKIVNKHRKGIPTKTKDGRTVYKTFVLGDDLR